MRKAKKQKLNIVIHGTWQKQLPKLADNSIDLIIIDPPYLLGKEGWDKINQVTAELGTQLLRVLKPTGNLYVWCGVGERGWSLMEWFPIFNKEFHFKQLVTLKKQRGNGNIKGWLYTREECMWFVKDNKKFQWNKRSQYSKQRRSRDWNGRIMSSQNGYKAKSAFKRWTNVWTDIIEESFAVFKKRFQHPDFHKTPKPIKALTRIILAHTDMGMTVLDCFSGSGSTAIASKILKRNYICIEAEEEFCEMSRQRIEEYDYHLGEVTSEK